MATRSFSNHDDILAARQALQPTRDAARLGGFKNLFAKELGEWFATRRWLWQSIIWLAIINVLIGFVMFIVPQIEGGLENENGLPASPQETLFMGLSLYFTMSVIAGTIGALILVQDEVIREKQSGTAAWILSKPVSRAAFILSKLLANILGVLVFIVALPGAVAYVEIALASGVTPAPLPFIAAMGVVLLGLVFYLSLGILLGVLFEQRGPLLGVGFGLMFGGLMIASFLPALGYILPLSLDKIALLIASGEPLDGMSIAQLVSAAGLSVAFTLIALRRFSRLEF